MKRFWNNILITLIFIAILILGYIVFVLESYYLLFVMGALLICLPFIYRFEKRQITIEELVLISVITAISVISRLVFAALPGSPVTAILIFTACFFGKETGFIVGVLTTLLSNLFLGHGAFTAFQMAAWGGIGFISGFFRPLIFPKRKPDDEIITNGMNYKIIIITIWGGIAGALFSLFMDIQTVLFHFNTFRWSYYLTIIAVAVPITIEYIVTNIIFVLLLYRPAYNIFNRLREKYGIGT